MTMSLSRENDDVRLQEPAAVATADQRRRQARTDANRWARETDAGVGLCAHDDGCVAVAVVGTGGPAQVRTLRSMRDRLAREAWAELVVDLSGLDGDCGPALVRVLGQLRVHRLTAGARVEVHGAPPALTAELGARPATAYTVRDAPSDG
ncbi:hypothetical protein LQ327_24875 [Actinomycetospora endophytica]|uniref:STAS domain-containing protein n=1 Tax=Actinomycetospora endophytica TaxID=2291215 RepID=A0ABS8PEC6_9PSEU|nr:hypothetical protein [Actinomycetospora endophytica]MCD2196611.1 hypothetical protein [Actinomycetospora endophytica]